MATVGGPTKRIAPAIVAATVVIALTIAAFALADRQAREAAFGEARVGANDDAAILAAGLQAELDKFSLVPLVLADDSEVREVLAAGRLRAPGLDRRFEQLARQTNASAIYLMNSEGLTIAASNWRLPTSFVGSNYSFRRYFHDAMANGSGNAIRARHRQPEAGALHRPAR